MEDETQNQAYLTQRCLVGQSARSNKQIPRDYRLLITYAINNEDARKQHKSKNKESLYVRWIEGDFK